MVYIALGAAIMLMVLALVVAGKDGIPVLTGGVPMLIGAAMAWSGITNWAEVRGIDSGYGQPNPDLSRQTVNVNPAAVVVKPAEGGGE